MKARPRKSGWAEEWHVSRRSFSYLRSCDRLHEGRPVGRTRCGPTGSGIVSARGAALFELGYAPAEIIELRIDPLDVSGALLRAFGELHAPEVVTAHRLRIETATLLTRDEREQEDDADDAFHDRASALAGLVGIGGGPSTRSMSSRGACSLVKRSLFQRRVWHRRSPR